MDDTVKLESAHSPHLTEHLTQPPDLDQLGEKKGYVLDSRFLHKGESTDATALKLARDNKTILIPQPSQGPRDPLNWGQGKKNLTLVIISATSFLADYASATGAVTLLPQAAIWDIPQDTVLHSLAGNVFMLGAGGIFVVAFSAYFGRLPVLFWFTCASLATAAWCGGATSFKSFMTARLLNGFFSTVAQAGGLMFIKDIFFFHEHARKINIWSYFIIVSPFLGPFAAAFIIWKLSWPWAYWVLTIMNAVCFIGIVAFMDETYYDRRIPVDQQPPCKSRLLRLIGVEQFHSRRQRNTFLQAVERPIQAILKIPVFLSTVYYLFTFAWLIGINTTLAIFLTPLYHFGPEAIGLFYFTPIIATTLGQIVGHWLHERIANLYIAHHGGRLEPEARLWIIWLSTPFMIAGIVSLGFSLQQGYHYMVTAVTWGLYVFGLMITTVAINAYLLDSYPNASGEVAAWISFGRTLGGFFITFFQVRWAKAMGTEKSFGIQAGICAAAFLLVIILQLFGKKLRTWQGGLAFKTS